MGLAAPSKRQPTTFLAGSIIAAAPPTIRIDGSATAVPVLAPRWYLPVAGDRAYCIKIGTQLHIMFAGPIGGTGGFTTPFYLIDHGDGSATIGGTGVSAFDEGDGSDEVGGCTVVDEGDGSVELSA